MVPVKVMSHVKKKTKFTQTGLILEKPGSVKGAPEPLYVGGYFPFSYLENGSIKKARSQGVSAAGGKPK